MSSRDIIKVLYDWVESILPSGTLTASRPVVTDASGLLSTVSKIPIAYGGTNSDTALVDDRLMRSSGGAIVVAPALTNGQLFIGSTGTAPAAASLTAGTGVTVTPGAGSISLAIGQSVAAAATPSFASATLSNTSSQLTLGTTTTTILTAPTPGSTQTLTIPDQSVNLGVSSTVMLTSNTSTFVRTGTWVPTVGDGTNLFTLTTALGYYSRIGDTVFFSTSIVWTSKGSASGAIRISAPFTCFSDSTNYRGSPTVSFSNGIAFASGMLAAQMSGNTAYFVLANILQAGTAPTAITDANCSAAGSLQLGGFFRTA